MTFIWKKNYTNSLNELRIDKQNPYKKRKTKKKQKLDS